MKRQIRRSVFETNSSSMHSLVIIKNNKHFSKKEVQEDFYLNKDGLQDIYAEDLYYGRSPFKILASVKDKALYALASMCNYKNDAVYNEICEAIRSYIPEFQGFDLDFGCEIYDAKYYSENLIKKYYGEGNYVKKGAHWICWGYKTGGVDEDILSGFLKKEKITITEFIKNKRFIVIVDGDEFCIYKDMKKTGLINQAVIEKEYTPGDWMEENKK